MRRHKRGTNWGRNPLFKAKIQDVSHQPEPRFSIITLTIKMKFE